MKLFTLCGVLAISAFAFTSCQKTYKCSCYSPSLNRSTPTTEIKDSKKDAKRKCEALPYSGQYTGSDYICNLK